ncbi:MAG: hypothetical protein Ct9H90mP21_2980 [Methanobacteriota archaeon]|nr:MAG: hypothetical protein Ct9H90mP21_2980 [Euryarchaeota archaeon]
MGAPVFRTLRDSDSPAFLSYQSLKEKSEQMASKDPSSNGKFLSSRLYEFSGESPRSALAELTLLFSRRKHLWNRVYADQIPTDHILCETSGATANLEKSAL